MGGSLKILHTELKSSKLHQIKLTSGGKPFADGMLNPVEQKKKKRKD